MAKKKLPEQKTCCFEWWDKETKSLKQCGKPAVFLYQEKFYLCEECSKSNTNNTALKRIL